MIVNAGKIADILKKTKNSDDPLVITPLPDIQKLKNSGSASVDLRLGTWFATMRQNKVPILAVDENADANSGKIANGEQIGGPLGQSISQGALDAQLVKMHYVPFGSHFILHPGHFVLGVTLEWIRLPKNLAGYVIGKSSWGRRGLIIATAAGVHPGFTGCLTLELSNCNEIPIAIKPGLQICQLFLHSVAMGRSTVESSAHAFNRKPRLGTIELDDLARKLGRWKGFESDKAPIAPTN